MCKSLSEIKFKATDFAVPLDELALRAIDMCAGFVSQK